MRDGLIRGLHACGRCGGHLLPLEVPQGEASGCDGCGGVWVDERAFAALRQGMEDEVVGVAEVLLARRRAADLGAPEPARCPVCAHALIPTQVSGVRVEFCAAHGTWLDHAEVEEVARAASVASDGHASASGWAERLSGDLGVLPAGLVAALGTVIALGEHCRRRRR